MSLTSTKATFNYIHHTEGRLLVMEPGSEIEIVVTARAPSVGVKVS